MADNNSLNFYMTFDSSSAKRDIESIRKSYKAMANEIGEDTDTPLLDNVIDSGKELYSVFKALSPQLKKATEARRMFAAVGNEAGITKENKAIEKITQSTKAFTKALTQLKSTQEGLNLAGTTVGLTGAIKSPEGNLKRVSVNRAKFAMYGAADTTIKSDAPLKFNRKAQTAIMSTDAGNIKQIVKDTNELGEVAKKAAGPWQKLWGRIRNISIYRAIRTGLKWITSGFREGLDNLGQYSDSVNKTMSNLNGSLQQIRNTMGIAFASVLQSLEPLLTTLADSLVDIINSFNLAMAKMSGKNVYTKAKKNVDDYAASLQKAQKFSFDTFEVLSGSSQASPQEMFEESNVNEDANDLSDLLATIFEIIKSISDIVNQVFSKLIDSGQLKSIFNIISSIAQSIGDIIVSLIDNGTLETIIDAVMDIVTFGSQILKIFAYVIGYLNKIGALKYILLGVATAFVAIKVAAMGAAIASAAQWIFAHPIIGTAMISAAALGLAGIASMIQSDIEGFANGGFTTANFIATNENGKREWIGRNAGATAVVNDTQMSDIMYEAVRRGSAEGMVQAIYETGLADAVGQTVTINGTNINDSAFARAIFPALKAESTRRGGNQL